MTFRDTPFKNARNRPVDEHRNRANGVQNEPGQVIFADTGVESPGSRKQDRIFPPRLGCFHRRGVFPRTHPLRMRILGRSDGGTGAGLWISSEKHTRSPDPTPRHFPGQGKAPKPPSMIIQKATIRRFLEAEIPRYAQNNTSMRFV